MAKKEISKAELKHAKKVEKEAILNEKKKVENKIDSCIQELKSAKDKNEKKKSIKCFQDTF